MSAPAALPDPELWGVSCDLTPVEGGARNRVLRSAPGNAPALVFKSTRRDAAALSWLEPVQSAARVAGFVVPALLRSRLGRLSECGWTCEPFVQGRAYEKREMPDLRPALDRFHQLTNSIPQRPGFARVTELLSMDLGGDVDLAAMPEILARQCRAAWRALGPGDVGVLDGDLNRLNVVRTPDGCPGLLDWDEARVDLRLFDLAQVSRRRPGAKALRAMQAWEMACSWRIEPPYALELARRHFSFGELSAPGDL